MRIREATPRDASLLAGLVSTANQDVAAEFGLNAENCPKHASFYQADWARADLARGVRYFVLEEEATAIGCVSYESPEPQLAYLNRLAVLPAYRRRGAGARLVEHVVAHARSEGIRTLSIGIIAEHTALHRWYLGLGFSDGETKRFDHLPFTVRYMAYAL